MNTTADLIVTEDCAQHSLTLRKYSALRAIGNAYALPEKGEATRLDLFAARIVLVEGAVAVTSPAFVSRVETELVNATDESIEAARQLVDAALVPYIESLNGMSGGGKKSVKGDPTCGLVAAILLRCAKEYGWTAAETLDTPLGTLMLMLREGLVQRGKAITYDHMDMIDRLKNAGSKPNG